MSDMRQRDGITEIRESRAIDLDGKRLTDIDAYLDEKAAGLIDTYLSIEADVYYDSASLDQFVVGWRPATMLEISQHASERNRAERETRAWQERQFTMLKSERPDLFQ